MALTLKENFLWSFLGNVVYGIFQWGVIIILCKLGNPEMVGHYALGISICAPIFMFASLNLRFVQATDTHNEYSFNHYWGLRLITTSLALLSVFIMVLVLRYHFELATVIVMVGVIKVVEALSDTIYGFLQRKEQMNFIGISLVIKSILSILALIISISLTKELFWGVSSLALASALTLIWYDSLRCCRINLQTDLLKTLRPVWERVAQLKLVRISLPLGFVGMLITLTFNIPRYFIEHYLGAKILGIYSAMFQLMLAGSIVMMAIGQSVQPRLAAYYASGKISAFCNILIKIAGIAGLLGGLGFLLTFFFGKHILIIFYNLDYANHVQSFQWVMLAAIFYYIATIFIFGVTAMRAFKKLLFPFISSVIIATLSSWYLIPKFGIVGAAWSLCIINVFNSIGLLVLITALLSKSLWEA